LSKKSAVRIHAHIGGKEALLHPFLQVDDVIRGIGVATNNRCSRHYKKREDFIMTDNINMTLRSQHEQPIQVDLTPEVFSDPSAYLRAFKSDFGKLDIHNKGKITKDDLLEYSINGKDTEAVAVARETLQHLDEIKQFRDDLPRYTTDTRHSEGLSPADVQLVDDAIHGNSDVYIAHLKSELKSGLTWDSLLGTGWGILTGLHCLAQEYPLAALTGSLTAFHAMKAFREYDDIEHAPENVNGAFALERDKIANWSEFKR
jgi:hypothetical protein